VRYGLENKSHRFRLFSTDEIARKKHPLGFLDIDSGFREAKD
jgi:hypothetical protein